MILISGAKLNATVAASREKTNLFPDIANNRSKTLSVKETRDPGREALENKSGLPQSLDAFKYCKLSLPEKAPRFAPVPVDPDYEAMERMVEHAAQPGRNESILTPDKVSILMELRKELLLFNPDRATVLQGLRKLVDLQCISLADQQARNEDLERQLTSAREEIEVRRREAAAAAAAADARAAELEAELADARHRCRETELQVGELEQRLATASAAGYSPQEVAAMATQLAKSRAAQEAYKQEAEELRGKAAEAEAARRREVEALRERHRAAHAELRALTEGTGPEKLQQLKARLEEVATELETTRQALDRSRVAQKQQHGLVVGGRIEVEAAGEQLREAREEAAANGAEAERRARRIVDLELLVQVREQDARRLRDQVDSLTHKLQDYMERLSRAAGQIKAQEALLRAATLRHIRPAAPDAQPSPPP